MGIFSGLFKNKEESTVDPRLQKWMSKDPKVAMWVKNGWFQAEAKDVQEYILQEWDRRGETVPQPHRTKVEIVASYGKRTGYKTLVETGTFLGKMIDAQKENYNRIFSIEVDAKFHADAKEKFKAYPYITFLLGDSGKLMKEVMLQLNEPAVFWLDAHYNNRSSVQLDKECPIYEELDCIFDSKPLDHVLLIDDARLFVGANDYPTIPDLTTYITKKRPDYKVEVADDIIRATKA